MRTEEEIKGQIKELDEAIADHFARTSWKDWDWANYLKKFKAQLEWVLEAPHSKSKAWVERD